MGRIGSFLVGGIGRVAVKMLAVAIMTNETEGNASRLTELAMVILAGCGGRVAERVG